MPVPRCLLTHCLQGVDHIPTRLRQKSHVIRVVQVGKTLRPNVATQSSLGHRIVQDFIHRPQEQVRSHSTVLNHSAVTPSMRTALSVSEYRILMRSRISCDIPWARSRPQVATLSTESKAALRCTYAIQSGWRNSNLSVLQPVYL